MSRRSGKTLALLIKAVEAARKGKVVIFVVHNHVMASYCYDLLLGVVVSGEFTYAKGGNSATHRSGGSVVFKVGSVRAESASEEASRITRGMRSKDGSKPTVIFDHYYLELHRIPLYPDPPVIKNRFQREWLI